MGEQQPRPRALPGTRSTCQLCKRPIVWAVTVAGPNGPGGRAQPFDPVESTEGNVAIRPTVKGRLYARALHKGETHDRTTEYLGMPHAATCAKPPVPPKAVMPENVVSLADARNARTRKARR